MHLSSPLYGPLKTNQSDKMQYEIKLRGVKEHGLFVRVLAPFIVHLICSCAKKILPAKKPNGFLSGCLSVRFFPTNLVVVNLLFRALHQITAIGIHSVPVNGPSDGFLIVPVGAPLQKVGGAIRIQS